MESGKLEQCKLRLSGKKSQDGFYNGRNKKGKVSFILKMRLQQEKITFLFEHKVHGHFIVTRFDFKQKRKSMVCDLNDELSIRPDHGHSINNQLHKINENNVFGILRTKTTCLEVPV